MRPDRSLSPIDAKKGPQGAARSAPGVLLATLVLLVTSPSPAKESTLVEFGSAMKYLDNRADPALGLSWTTEGFNDAAWASGAYGVGYDTSSAGAQALILTTVPPHTVSVYTRARFTITDVTAVHSVLLGADWDDGWIAWINGTEVYRSPEMPEGSPAWNTAPSDHESSNGTVPNYGPGIDVSAAALPALHDGENVLAVGVWNHDAWSSDLVVVPRLSINRPTASIVRGPYLQRVSPQSIVVRWRTGTPTDSGVRWGASPQGLTNAVTMSGARTEHELAITGLQPDKRYFYSAGTILDSLVGEDADHVFTTPPRTGVAKRTRIWVLGDSGTGGSVARSVRNAYTTFTSGTPTDFWMMLGDNAYPAGTDGDYQVAVFEMYPDMLRRSVLRPAYGNHDALSADADAGTGPYFDVFTLPTQGESGGLASGREAYYAFDHGDIHVVVLDSSQSSRAADGPMAQWVRDDLAATSADWIIAIWHHPPYSKGSHDSDEEDELIEMRQNFLPILEQAGVDVVMSGHSHSYERSFFLDGHYGFSSTFTDAYKKDGGDGRADGDGVYEKPTLAPTAHAGTVYLVAGCSGGISGGPLDHPAMFTSANHLGSVILDIAGNRLDETFLGNDGTILDHFSIVKEAALLPVVDFTGEPRAGVAPLTVQFRDLTINGPTAWSWDLDGDGLTDATARDPARTYAIPGVYAVGLTAMNLAGTAGIVRDRYLCVTESAPPGPVPGLRLDPDRETLVWDLVPDATYDVAKGDLGLLVAGGGDFADSSLGCLAARVVEPHAQDAASPNVGDGYYYLVRAVDCAGRPGSYDSTSGSQAGSRNVGTTGCP